MSIRKPIQIFNLITATAATATSSTALIKLPTFDFDSLTIRFNVSSVSGTTPTLDVYLQTTSDGGTTWVDMAHFAQKNASAATYDYVMVGNENNGIVPVAAVGSKTISASTLGAPLLSENIQVAYTIGGTSPSFNFTVDAIINQINRGV